MGRRAVVGCVVALLVLLVAGVAFLNLVGVTQTTAATVGCTGEVRPTDVHLPHFMPITRPEPGTTVSGKVEVNRRLLRSPRYTFRPTSGPSQALVTAPSFGVGISCA